MKLPPQIIGLNALEFVCHLSSIFPEIAAVNIAVLPFAPLHNSRAPMAESDQKVVRRAQELREQISIPFWDAAMISASSASAVPLGVLAAAKFHQTLAAKTQRLNVNDLNLELLIKISNEAAAGSQLVALTSLVNLHGQIVRHIPLLDFHCKYSPEATEVVITTLRELNQHGVLFSSGKSYHFYGTTLLDEEKLRVFLGRALLFSPITDKTWIAHQLIEGCCALRISSRKDYGGPPKVVSTI
jgi:hypothetical protein